MITPDMINAGFEVGAGFAVLHHCWRLRQDKQVRGVSAPAVMFFTLWGIWNIFFYPHLGQYWSFIGGIFVTLANVLYVAMFGFYQGWHYKTRRAVGWLVCLMRGHDFRTPVFTFNCLYFCTRCGAELFDRSIDDLRQMPPLSDEDLEQIHRSMQS